MLGKAKLLKIYLGESERSKNKPLYQYLVRWLKEKGISGVTPLAEELKGTVRIKFSIQLVS